MGGKLAVSGLAELFQWRRAVPFPCKRCRCAGEVVPAYRAGSVFLCRATPWVTLQALMGYVNMGMAVGWEGTSA